MKPVDAPIHKKPDPDSFESSPITVPLPMSNTQKDELFRPLYKKAGWDLDRLNKEVQRISAQSNFYNMNDRHFKQLIDTINSDIMKAGIK